jgi:competence protein ComEC
MCASTQRLHVESASYQPLVVALAAACAGVTADSLAPLNAIGWWSLAALSWSAWWFAWRASLRHVAVAPLLISLACTAAAWHHCRWSLFASDHVGLFAPEVAEPVALEVRAARGPRRIPPPPYDPLRTVGAPERTRLDVDAVAIRDGELWQPTSGRMTLFVDGVLSGVDAGDRLRVFGQLAAVHRPSNPGEFDRARYARADRRLCGATSEFIECVSTIEGGPRWSAARMIDALRTGGDALLWRALRPQRSGLASAMFLGSREELEPERAEAYMETGTIHLLVISGLNVGILASCLFLLMRTALVSDRFALFIVGAACLLYAVATDAQPPVVRATVMVLVACTAMVLGRRPWGYNSIAAAGLVVLAINPSELFRAGTQLSFLSVAVLAWFAQRWRKRAELDPLDRLIAATRPWQQKLARRAWNEIGRVVMVSLAIWLVICPLVMARFHLLSPVAVVLGPVLSVPVALSMASGFAVLAFGWIAPLAATLGWVCDVNLALMDDCVAAARGWRGNHFWVPGPHDWWLAGFYAALACWALVPRWTPPRRWCVALLAGWCALGLATSFVGRRDSDTLACTFLSVGHGSAAVVELPGGQTMLYDAGRLGAPGFAASTVAGYLWSRGITHLDAIVLSHADADHYNAVPELIKQFSVGAIYVSPMMFERPSRGLDELRAAIDRSGVPLGEVWAGDRLAALGTARIDVLHPPRQGVLDTDNANSIVISIEHQSRRLLLTGDLEGRGLQEVMSEAPCHADVLLAPHHGSAQSDPPGFSQWCTPNFAVVSGGPRDRVESVAEAYAAHGARVLHTATDGAVHCTIVGAQLNVDSWRRKGE